jgi:hypothetical protein
MTNKGVMQVSFRKYAIMIVKIRMPCKSGDSGFLIGDFLKFDSTCNRLQGTQ